MILRELRVMNALDIELYEYARELVARRLKAAQTIAPSSVCSGAISSYSSVKAKWSPTLRGKIGLFQSNGHKGPERKAV